MPLDSKDRVMPLPPCWCPKAANLEPLSSFPELQALKAVHRVQVSAALVRVRIVLEPT
jgi:hypothetical protein